MRYAIISDIHSNLEAFTAILNDIEIMNVDETVCLGDVVGYNANPNKCVDLIKERDIKTVMGNHDRVAAGSGEPVGFNHAAREAVLWTRERLTEENKQFLLNLPLSLDVDGKFLMVHGSVDSTDDYIFNRQDVVQNFRLLKELGTDKLCFFGHTHIPAAYTSNWGKVLAHRVKDFFMDSVTYYMINPGSVGQPRDGDARAAYVLYDSKRRHISFHWLDYEVDLASRKDREAGLPIAVAERLKRGV
ncbi:MAG: metallophosphoesterase family protein [Thermodesulfobacteriota bacterium]